MSKIKSTLKILKKFGFKGLISAIFSKLLVSLIPARGYTQYTFEYTPINIKEIMSFLRLLETNTSDLVVVPEIYKHKIRQNCLGQVISTLDTVKEQHFANFERLVWATERVDRGASIARWFYRNNKKVEALPNTGPARSWMHDQVKENVLVNELKDQQREGIAKFDHGIGADFGNLLQCIDNAKTLAGDFVEIGCYMGSSTCVIANYIEQNNINKKLFVYDYFDGFTYEEAQNSIDNSWKNTHRTDGKDKVKARVASRLISQLNNLHVYQRNIIDNDALKEVNQISFANIDVDLYEAVYAALIHVHEKLCINGIIVVEDAGHSPRLIGAKVALEDFIDLVGKDTYHSLQMESGQYILIKRAYSINP